MSFYRRLPDGLLVLEARPHHAEQLAALQIACFPTLAEEERFKAEHFRKHMELFPAGQIIIVDPISGPTGCEDKVVAATATVRLNFDFGHATHTFADIIQGGWLTSHQPDGPWLYGADISTLPTYRGRGLATALYAARQELVYRLGLEGQVTAGMIPGYGKVKATVSAEQYYADVLTGVRKDATLSTQIRVGFEPRGLLANYLNDPVCDNYAVLLVLPASRDVAGADRTHAGDNIRLHTAIPGPASQALVARRMAAVPSGWGKATDLAIERAEGALVHDADGNTLIDLAGGIGMLAAGHCPPQVVEAIVAQSRRSINPCSLLATNEPMVHLAELLNEITPGTHAKKTIFANSGAEAVENAVKLARKHTGRSTIVCFEGGYHGRTLLTLSLTSKYGLFKSGFGPFAPEIVRLPFPQIFRRPTQLSEDQYLDLCLQQLETAMVAQVDPSAIAAILIEPVQGEAGFIPVPPRFFQRLRDLATQHGIVLIADEVQSGFGRTGKLFACEHYGVVPDLIATAKALAAGFPIGAVTGRAEIMDSAHLGGVGSTYGGGPLACAAAIATVEIIRQPGFLAHATHLGNVMREVMARWQQRWPIIGEARGLGPMMVVELVADPLTKVPLSVADTLSIVKASIANGVVLIRAGLFSNCIRFLPPLTIGEAQLREGLAAVERALAAFADRPTPPQPASEPILAQPVIAGSP